jgi:hypothetical protein
LRDPIAGAASILISALCLMLCLTLIACGLGTQQHRRYCTPQPGMTTEQLVACGCLLHDNGGLAMTSVARAEGGPEVQSIVIVNYICPLGERGIARVSVANGVADAVFY